MKDDTALCKIRLLEDLNEIKDILWNKHTSPIFEDYTECLRSANTSLDMCYLEFYAAVKRSWVELSKWHPSYFVSQYLQAERLLMKDLFERHQKIYTFPFIINISTIPTWKQ